MGGKGETAGFLSPLAWNGKEFGVKRNICCSLTAEIPVVAAKKPAKANVVADGREVRKGAVTKRFAARDSGELDEDTLRQKLITDHSHLPPFLAKKLGWATSPHFDDIVQEGLLALIFAANKYDRNMGRVAFSTYASYWIRQAMKRAHIKSSLLKVPFRKFELARQVQRATRELQIQLGRDPSEAELAAHLTWSEKKTSMGMDAASEVQNSLGFLSLDEVNDRNTDLKTLVEYRHLKFDGLARDYREAVEAMEAVERILDETLSPGEKEILRVEFGLGNSEVKTKTQLAREMNTSVWYINKARNSAIEKLREKKEDLVPLLSAL
uniref:RNA polymerase sigma-70 region 2 domain-containing protein n=1 Tax=Rhodosorus marinus TaxID=101924 RepID=A0A7S3EB26_9RHOD|mmetsp:Transcript_21843/g.88942  ORF Transcript_21843/g.88942 Transcript_21843/m.88942 type:complete len:324 (+) Transcript_21843:302-1273(+)|eukprot:CAMPEP_0113969856 /NCGR_PEP_ID=MMETSP0011_2-20120614/10641_1 /TAXON_ID=101924 /ORGANISM="Rhodosorus marinus" /LENGTH=323 /DNA_ID=CAMNT_0000983743 /DNA_START=246 /DNA_END=1217 /DNA_ORIENTATION=+ /assembly_acc=CAM_ASM_000156